MRDWELDGIVSTINTDDERMSDEHDNDDSRDLTMEVSGDELSKLRQSSQLHAFSREEVGELSQLEDDSTKAINRENLVEIIKSEIRESSDSPQQQGFGIIKRNKPAKIKSTRTSKPEFPKPQVELGSINSDATMTVNAETLRSLRAGEDPMESTLEVPPQQDAVDAMFDALGDGDETLVGSYDEMVGQTTSGLPELNTPIESTSPSAQVLDDLEQESIQLGEPQSSGLPDMSETEVANHISIPTEDDVLPKDVSGELDRAAVIAAAEAQNQASNTETSTEVEPQVAQEVAATHQSEEIIPADDAGGGKLPLIIMGLVLLLIVGAVALKLSGLLGV